MIARPATLAALLLATVPSLASPADIAPFSGARPGAVLPAGWRPLTLPRIPPTEVALVDDTGLHDPGGVARTARAIQE